MLRSDPGPIGGPFALRLIIEGDRAWRARRRLAGQCDREARPDLRGIHLSTIAEDAMELRPLRQGQFERLAPLRRHGKGEVLTARPARVGERGQDRIADQHARRRPAEGTRCSGSADRPARCIRRHGPPVPPSVLGSGDRRPRRGPHAGLPSPSRRDRASRDPRSRRRCVSRDRRRPGPSLAPGTWGAGRVGGCSPAPSMGSGSSPSASNAHGRGRAGSIPRPGPSPGIRVRFVARRRSVARRHRGRSPRP